MIPKIDGKQNVNLLKHTTGSDEDEAVSKETSATNFQSDITKANTVA